MKYLNISLVLLILQFLQYSPLVAQSFTEQTDITLPGIYNGSNEWGDYDKDGDLDLLLTGRNSTEGIITRIYRNDGDNTFNELSTASIPGIERGESEWVDYDNDGLLDVFITGYNNGSYRSSVYRNNGDNTFIEQTDLDFPECMYSSSDWGDFDNDGDPDLLLSGKTHYSGLITKIYRNNGDKSFTEMSGIKLPGVETGSVDWIDYDNDGNLDILLTGATGTGPNYNSISSIYRNNGDNSFTEQDQYALPGVRYGASAWGDYDNDGYADLLLTGIPDEGYAFTSVYHNDNGLAFSLQSQFSLEDVYGGSAKWGDYDNDGFSDILMTGSWNWSSVIYRNENGTGFTEMTNLDHDHATESSVSWGDYDGDGDLDYILSGYVSQGIEFTSIYMNNNVTANSPPSVPGGTYEQVEGNTVIFHWDHASDPQSPQSGLTYNLQIGTTVYGVDICSPMADLNTGYREIARAGGIRNNSWTIRTLSPGTYNWRVQALDQAYDGSDFSANGSFTVSFGNSISPTEDQELLPGISGNALSVSETLTPDSRQWKYSTSTGGPYEYDIAGAAGESYTPVFSDFGCYYVVCVSEQSGSHVTSNEVFVNVPRFTEQEHIQLSVREAGSVSWGDYDNDGDLDILLGNSELDGYTPIYRNNGNFTFTYQDHIHLPSVLGGTAIWGDYDNDGDLDVLISGFSMADYRFTSICRNNGDNTFSEQTDISLTGVSSNSLIWEDTDSDGDLDIILAGNDETGDQVCKLYRNDGNNIFTEVQPCITPFYRGDMAAGDYDNDGYLDLLLTGIDYAGNEITKVYRNNGDNTFSEQSQVELRVVEDGSVDWGDYDNDGNLDILYAGREDVLGTETLTAVYRNNGDNSFVELTGLDLTGAYNCSASWVDHDNDGDLDAFIIGGSYMLGQYSGLYTNNGDQTFSEQLSSSLPPLDGAEAEWGDYDKDSDLDLLLHGVQSGITYVTKIYRNNSQASNSGPGTPDNLSSSVFAGGAFLSWDRSSDTETPADGLGYNVSISTIKDSSNIASPMSDLENGYRRIPDKGNAFQNAYTITGLDTGQYYWRVQAVDNSFAGSDFSPVDSFTVVPSFSSLDVGLHGVIYSTVLPGDYDADGDMDILVMGDTLSWNQYTEIYRNDGNDVFTAIDAGLEGLRNGAASWCDFDNDGDLDLTISGMDNWGAPVTAFYMNNGTDSFIEQTGDGFIDVHIPAVAWGDLDNDGLQDLLLAGSTGAHNSRIYLNNGDLSFTELAGDNIVDVTYCSVALGDYDKDMDLDILINGTAYNGGYYATTEVYRNDGNGIFTNIEAGLLGLRRGDVSWGDYDNDGDLDIVLSGEEYAGDKYTKIYRNDGNDQFTDIQAFIRGAVYATCVWGDYENDGDLDILFSGYSGTILTEIYRNDGDGNFTEVDFGFAPIYSRVGSGSPAWLDFDNDRDLDVLSSGSGIGFDRQTTLYRNNGNWQNDRPAAPANLHAGSQGYGIRLGWDPASDDQTPSQSLSYNIRIGTGSGAIDIITPMSDLSTGDLYVPAMGNCNLNTGWCLDSLPVGTYFWSVQAVDHTFVGGDWASEQSFVITSVNADFESDTVCEGLSTGFTDLSLSSGDPFTGWSWEFGDGGTSTEQHPTHLYPAAGTYPVRLIASTSSYSDTIFHDVVVKPGPLLDFLTDVVCQGNSSTITNLSQANGTTILGWDWDFGDGTASSLQHPGTHGYINAGDYTIQLSVVADNGCDDMISEIATVAEFPEASISLAPGYNNTYCSDDSTILLVSNHPDYTFQWQLNEGDMFGETDTSLLVRDESGDYSILVTNPAAGCISMDNMQVTVNPAPSQPTIEYTGNLEFCDRDSVELHVASVAGYTYNWKLNGGAVGTNSETYKARSQGEYSLVVVNDNGCEAGSSNTLIVVVNDNPVVSTIGSSGPTNFCEGESVVLSVTNDPDAIYQWYRDGYLEGGATNSHTATTTGLYQVRASYTSGCEAISSNTVDVQVSELPDIPVINADPPTTFCEGGSVELSVPEVAGLSYQWQKDGYPFAGATESTLLVNTSGSYGIRVSNASFCEATSLVDLDVTVIDTPMVSLIDKDGSTSFCEGESVTLSVVDNLDWDFQWRKNGGLLTGEETNSLTVTESGYYHVEALNTDGCMAVSNTQPVNVISSPEAPVIYAASDTVFCEGGSVELSTPFNEQFEYSWKRNDGDVYVYTNSYELTEPGTYRVDIVTAGAEECSYARSNDIYVRVIDKPDKLEIVAERFQMCEGESELASVDELPGLSYRWLRDGEGIPGGSASSYTISSSGEYVVEVQNTEGCVSLTNPKTFDVYELPRKPLISEKDGKSDICPGEQVNLQLDNYNEIYTYQWLKNGAPGGVAGPVWSGALDEAEYSVVASVGECINESDRFTITWKDALAKPGIAAYGPNVWYLSCSNEDANMYRWYHEGMLVEEGGEHIYVAGQEMGLYRVEISDDGTCYSSSDVISIPENMILGMDQDIWENLNIYPNPTPGLFTLEMDNAVMGELIIDIFGESGTQIINIKFLKETTHFKTEIDLSAQPAGLYLIGLLLEEYSTNRKLIVE